jgi:hypothetical protein
MVEGLRPQRRTSPAMAGTGEVRGLIGLYLGEKWRREGVQRRGRLKAERCADALERRQCTDDVFYRRVAEGVHGGEANLARDF